ARCRGGWRRIARAHRARKKTNQTTNAPNNKATHVAGPPSRIVYSTLSRKFAIREKPPPLSAPYSPNPCAINIGPPLRALATPRDLRAPRAGGEAACRVALSSDRSRRRRCADRFARYDQFHTPILLPPSR